MEGIQLSLFGRTFRELSTATAEMISSPCCGHSQESGEMMYLSLQGLGEKSSGCTQGASWEMVRHLPGGCWTPSIGESPNVASESTLWQILEANAPEKYYLSARACAGILRRAERRGKELPPMLREALEEAIRMARM